MPDKKYLAVGGYLETGRLLSAMEVAQSHGINPAECVLVSSEAMARGMVLTPNKIVLRPWSKNPLEVAK